MPRALFTFTAVLCIAALLGPYLAIPFGLFWPLAFVAALGLAAFAMKAPGFSRGRSAFLCDSCKYDDPRYCSRPERPNATSCPDYRRAGGG